MMMLKILLMLSLTLVFAVSVKYPTKEADAEKLMLEIKNNPKGGKSKEIYSMLQAEHDKLKQEGYIFLGWRGIHPSKHQRTAAPPAPPAVPVNVDDYLQHKFPKYRGRNANFANKFYNNGREWQGLWLATFVDVCYGYVDAENDKRIDRAETYLPWIFRVYLKKSDIEKIHDDDVQMWQNGAADSIDINRKPLRSSEYIYYGREDPTTPTNWGFEMVLSPSVAQKARFLLSTFTAIGYGVSNGAILTGRTKENTGELNKRTMKTSGTAKGKLVDACGDF